MDQNKIGQFIAQCRKEKNVTQAQLAEQLGITDRAVSKWETGNGMPDSSIMLELCERLGITVTELLSGERIDDEGRQRKADESLIVLKQKDENNMTKNEIVSIILSGALMIGAMVCLICDMATAHRFTWSVITTISIVFAWSVCFPVAMMGKRGVIVSLAAVTVLIFPYFFLLSRAVGVNEVWSMGAAESAVALIFAWAVAALFRGLGKGRRWFALGGAFLLAVPWTLLANLIVTLIVPSEAGELDAWDLASVFTLLIFAFASFVCGYARKKRGIR